MRLTSLLNPGYVYQRRDRIWPRIKAKGHKQLKEVQRFMAVNGLPITVNDRKLAALKDKHKGQRCFVIGNGPSLLISDLDRLKGEVTFASNRIYLAFDQTGWRPTYYAAEDRCFAQESYETINNLHGFTKLFPTYLNYYVPPFKDSIYFYLHWEKLWVKEFNYPQLPCFGINPLDRVYAGCSITYVLFQLACFMGIREIYLIGVDFNYVVPEKPKIDTTGALISEGEQNHFHPNYLKPGQKWSLPRLYMQEKAHLAAREAVQQLGGQIFNATRGGKLEIFPRVDFDTLF